MKPILYAEDEADDITFMVRAFQRAEIIHPLKTVADGDEALAYLAGSGKYADRELHPLPGLVMLDLNLPLTSGFDVLKWIRTTPSVAALPVLILTSSSLESDMHRCSALGANGYLVKPGQQERLLEMVKAIKNYWLSHDRLTTKPDFNRPPGANPNPLRIMW